MYIYVCVRVLLIISNFYNILLYMYMFIVYSNLTDLKLQFSLQDSEQRIFVFVKIKINWRKYTFVLLNRFLPSSVTF